MSRFIVQTILHARLKDSDLFAPAACYGFAFLRSARFNIGT